MVGPQQFAKINVLKVHIFFLPIFLVTKLRSMAQFEWKKHPYIFFSTFGSKIDKFGQKKSEINKKIPNTHNLQVITLTSNSSKHPKAAGNYPNI